MVEDEPVAESSKRAETYVDVAPSLKDLGNRDKSQTEKVRPCPDRLWRLLIEPEGYRYQRD